ncbi:hypothetical protein GCM10022270_34430 [Terriglobus aquaticus]
MAQALLGSIHAFYTGHVMPFPWKTCVVCGEEFELRPDKPGYANRCLECTEQDTAAAQKQSMDATERQSLNEMNEARRSAIRNMLYRKES